MNKTLLLLLLFENVAKSQDLELFSRISSMNRECTQSWFSMYKPDDMKFSRIFSAFIRFTVYPQLSFSIRNNFLTMPQNSASYEYMNPSKSLKSFNKDVNKIT